MKIDELQLESLVREVLGKLIEAEDGPKKPVGIDAGISQNGVFTCIEQAIRSARDAQVKLASLCIEKRKEIIAAMRNTVIENTHQLAVDAVEETGMGKVGDKIKKNILAAAKTPGVEDISPVAYTGDHGFTLVERAPYGVIGAITPSTNPSETVICNGIGMIAAGNAVVFNPHPAAKKVTQLTVKLLNMAIVSAGGPENLLTTVENSTSQTGMVLMEHPDIRLMVVTGGPEIVRIAMKSGKKVIAAGPGNPPVVVDETADMENAAKCIVDGASFDNNLLCIAEKEVFVVDIAAGQLKNAMLRHGAYELNRQQLEKLMDIITVKREGNDISVNKKFVGRDIKIILKEIGIEVPDDIRLAIVEVDEAHPLVNLEQLMPVLPIVRAKDVNQAVKMAVKAEQRNGHTAMMHSRNIENLSKMAKEINTSIFVKNGPSYAGLGMLGEGFATFTIASPTGEGLTSPVTFTRQRRCVLKDQFRIV
ncbi:MAG: aldehyde dehydrogenase EutE [Ruminiclostridium sp.]|nr:aldehyde dehydrogenase EutE [Ruminiclostridium sp.]